MWCGWVILKGDQTHTHKYKENKRVMIAKIKGYGVPHLISLQLLAMYSSWEAGWAWLY